MQSAHLYAGANHSSVKQSNASALLRAIRLLGPVPRVELARHTGLNPATVTNLVEELIAGRLVRESGPGTARVGRRPVNLEVNAEGRYAIGVDIARSAISAALVDLAGRPHQTRHLPAEAWSSEKLLAVVRTTIEELLDDLPAEDRAQMVGIGVGAPGPLSIRSGRFVAPPTFGRWQDLALQDELQSHFRLPTRVDNNANASALAELWFGAGQGIDNFVLLTMSSGVGSGIVIGGDLYRGAHDLAGELGHMSINALGPRCACGNYGCLELYTSVRRVLGFVQAALASGEPSLLHDLVERQGELTLDLFLEAIKEQDVLAGRIFADMIRYLAAGIINISNALDPQLILIGRDLARAGDLLLVPLREAVGQRAMAIHREGLRIETTALPDAPVIGAATLVLRELFFEPLPA